MPVNQMDEKYGEDHYFEVIDVQHVFTEDRLKNSFIAMLVVWITWRSSFIPRRQARRGPSFKIYSFVVPRRSVLGMKRLPASAYAN